MWKKDGTALSEADTDIQTTDRSAKIRIPDAQRTDTGEYELTLTNEVGSEIIPIPVRVLGERHFHLYLNFWERERRIKKLFEVWHFRYLLLNSSYNECIVFNIYSNMKILNYNTFV